jgi:hypothetical protein
MKAGHVAKVDTGEFPMIKAIKVAAYRAETDHLFRVANVDYHACVGVGEVENWQRIACCVLAGVEGIECKRASAYDVEQFAQAVAAVKSRLDDSVQRIAAIKAEATA